METWMADGEDCADRESFWRDHIVGWKSSGLSLRAYSAHHGVKAGTLSYWNSRLKPRPAESAAAASDAGPTFLTVRVAEPALAMPEPADDRIEVVVSGGRVVRVSRNFDGGALERLLAVLERRR
jgi:transposase